MFRSNAMLWLFLVGHVNAEEVDDFFPSGRDLLGGSGRRLQVSFQEPKLHDMKLGDFSKPKVKTVTQEVEPRYTTTLSPTLAFASHVRGFYGFVGEQARSAMRGIRTAGRKVKRELVKREILHVNKDGSIGFGKPSMLFTSGDDVGTSALTAAAVIGVVMASGVIFAIAHVRRGVSAVSKEPLLATQRI
eukprot:gnl/MRDRNA2_/MRDRNA2_70036_c0_seq1.p1 gnl/MRDRNA2_/MRDRNA2_70036_c0~~gnl/MRDRNA2_/MRDRNA2_70036_c0_seq1.p1  ORF type:complete len:189 (+),score=25.13 gnl/MRDRNA2_/MRDRNA2_70036_c0_seq1:94-660(+)